MKLNRLVIDEKEQIFIDGVPLQGVLAYKLEHHCKKTAKLTVSMYVSASKNDEIRRVAIRVGNKA